MNKKIPLPEDYKLPFYSPEFRCYHCGIFGLPVKEIKDDGIAKFAYKFWWLCPKCFKKLIIDRIDEKIKVCFT